jgi:hypothetical protein
MVLMVIWLCWFGGASLYALGVLACRPRLWLLSLAVLATSAALVLYLPVRGHLHTPSSMDANADGIGIFLEFVAVVVFVGPFHLGFLLMLVGWHIQERKWDAKK